MGAWGPKLVLFGGLAPRYLVADLPEGIEPHTGTTDLDVVIGVAVLGEEQAVYTKLQEELRAAGFEPAAAGSFAWQRSVDGVPVVIEFFCPVEAGGAPGRLHRNPTGEEGSAVSAIQLRGAELAGRDCRLHRLDVDALDHGGHRSVEVNVVNVLPFVVLKAFALESRDKEKDAYDLVWTLSAFSDGPAGAAASAAHSSIAGEPDVHDAIEILRERFGDLEAQGPSNFARFHLGASDNEEERERLRRFAKGAVDRFLEGWSEATS